MKQSLTILFLIFTKSSFSQDVKCFKSLKETKDYLLGDWVEKNKKTQYIYRITNNSQKIVVEILVDLGNIEFEDDKFLFESNQVIEVKNNDGCFKAGIEIKRKFGSVFDDFQFLSKNEFSYMDKVFVRAKT